MLIRFVARRCWFVVLPFVVGFVCLCVCVVSFRLSCCGCCSGLCCCVLSSCGLFRVVLFVVCVVVVVVFGVFIVVWCVVL